MNVNKTFLLGNVSGQPELGRERNTPTLTFMLSVSETWQAKSGRTGTRVDVVRCRVYGLRSEMLAKQIVDGERLYVDGKYRREVIDCGGVPTEIGYVEVGNLEMARELK